MTVDGNAEGIRALPTHPWIGQRVAHKATGRTGRVGLIVEHLDRGRRYGSDPVRERVVWREAHVRPDDGSGMEWQANLTDLRREPTPDPPPGGEGGA